MSISREGDRVELADAYDELERTHHHRAIKLTSNGSQIFEDEWQLDPAGGLARTEVGELVAVDIMSFFSRLQAGQNGQAKGFFELSRDEEAQVLVSSGHENRVDRSPLEGGDNANSEGTFIDSPINAGSLMAIETESAIDVSAGGGGYSPSVVSRWYDFRNMFGIGPLFDDNDEVHEHYQVNKELGNDWTSLSVELDFALYWDVHEFQDLDRVGSILDRMG